MRSQQPFPEVASPLGPLAGLVGKWSGRGFNVIWRPNHTAGQDRFLELNVTSEQLEFTAISGQIPNRGLLQPDINMFGLTYLQQISDANLKAGLHIEPGLWVAVPKTSNPNVVPTVARLASIPHGTVILVQGTASTAAAAPNIPAVSIKPFTHRPAERPIRLPRADPGHAHQLPDLRRRADRRHAGHGQRPQQRPARGDRGPAHHLHDYAARDHRRCPGARRRDREYRLPKGGAQGPNAVTASVSATFWLETVQGQPAPSQLQYAQTVMLNFNGLSWPHITVGTLRKA